TAALPEGATVPAGDAVAAVVPALAGAADGGAGAIVAVVGGAVAAAPPVPAEIRRAPPHHPIAPKKTTAAAHVRITRQSTNNPYVPTAPYGCVIRLFAEDSLCRSLATVVPSLSPFSRWRWRPPSSLSSSMPTPRPPLWSPARARTTSASRR